jgi:hypothetical protein
MANVYDGRPDANSSDDDDDIRPPATARPARPYAFGMRSGLLARDGMLDLSSDLSSDADEDDAPCRRPVQQAPAPATSGSCNAGPAAAGSGTALDDGERAAKRKPSAMAARARASASPRPHRQGPDPPARVANESCDAGGGIPKRTRKCAGSGGGATTHQKRLKPQQRARPHRLLSRDRENYTEAFEEYKLLRTIYRGDEYAFDVMRAKAKLDAMGAKWRAHPENKFSTLCLIRSR